MTALVLAEHDNRTLKPASRVAIAAALKLAASVHVLVAGSACRSVAEAASQVAGVDKVLLADATQFADQTAENVAAQLSALLPNAYTHVLAPSTGFGKNVLPRVAAKLDVAQISDITAVIAADTFERPIYAGNVVATVQSSDPVKVITVRTTAFEPAGEQAPCAIEAVQIAPAFAATTFVGRELAVSGRPELTAARIVVSGGRGIGSADNFAILGHLADKLQAAIGASRAAVDAGYAPNDWQVGQTGKIVAPDLYIAVGISGAIQHLAGMKDSKVIVAINKDAEAPIFGMADYGLIGDFHELVPELTAKL
jgi:electron transfer flavoprotein alpha subunit